MKDLDKTQVYDLRGITEEQAKDLYECLCCYEEGWNGLGYRHIIEVIEDSLVYFNHEWVLSDSKPTVHISTLFEQTYEQQLQEAKKKLEHYKKEVERLENESKTEEGDVCKFWNYFEGDFAIGILTAISEVDSTYECSGTTWFKHAKKLTEQEVINLLFKKS